MHRCLSLRSRVMLLCMTCMVGMFIAACRGQTSKSPPVVPIRNMHDQPRYDAQAESPLFNDKRAMRPQVEGTIAREMEPNMALQRGRNQDDTQWLPTIPADVLQHFGDLQATATRGRSRYGIYCTPCHAASGNGKGTVPLRVGPGPLQPPSFHIDRLRHIPDGQLYATITNGIRNMPSYRHSIPLMDRWAIVAYVRALQLAQSEKQSN